MRLHVIAPPNTRLVKHVWSTCPFTQRTIGLVAALRRTGHEVFEYANHGSETEAEEKVVVLGQDEYVRLLDQPEGALYAPAFPTRSVRAFWERLPQLLATRARRDGSDVFMITVPPPDLATVDGLREVPGAMIVEPGVGYDRAPFGAARVYESEAWRHYMWGRYKTTLRERQLSAVIPWVFDSDDWPLGDGSGGYVSYLGRLSVGKGIETIFAVARMLPWLLFKVAGPAQLLDPPANVKHVGPLFGQERVAFLGRAAVHLCPTEYVEPLGGSAIEAMLCGTPVVASSWGGFTETVLPGETGLLAATAGGIAAAITACEQISRPLCRAATVRRFSSKTAATKWNAFLSRLART